MKDYSDALQQKLKGKRILFVGVKFYHFTDEIISKLKQHGALVSFYYERDTSIAFGFAKSFRPSYADKLQENHYKWVISDTRKKEFDCLLVIRGYEMKPWFVEQIKKDHPGIKTLLYQWDSYSNWECDYRPLIPYFDEVKTFDLQDAQELGLSYVPTFSSDEYASVPRQTQCKYDLFYTGGYTTPRMEFLKQLMAYSQENNLRLFTHVVMPRKAFLKDWITGTRYNTSLISLKSLSKSEYLEIFTQSNVIIDYTKDSQAGLTMRSLDVFAAGKKLLTNNAFVTRESYYNPEQSRIFDPKKFEVDREFATTVTSFPRQDFSIDKWLNSLFS